MTNGSGVGQTLQLLLKHVNINKNGEFDATGMFTKECYEKWLKKKPISSRSKRPEEAYRKIIVAHIEGYNGVTTFTPKVEQSILKIIRIPKVWTCFKHTKVKVGSRGFHKLGYWERQYLLSSTTLEDFIIYLRAVENEEIDFLLKYKLNGYISYLFNVSFLAPTNIERSTLERQLGMCSLLQATVYLFGETSQTQSLDICPLSLTTRRQQEKIKKPLEFKFGVNKEFLFSNEFQLPVLNERIFFPDRLIGTLLDNPTNCSILDMDDVGRNIYKGSIIGGLATEFHVFQATHYFCQDSVVDDLFNYGEAWNRTVEYRVDGSILIALNRYYIKNGRTDIIYIDLQDITDKYDIS